MHEWQAWLDEVSGQTLPGGVSVAAVAAAMGAALAAKAIRVTLARAELSPGDRQTFEAAATATREAQVALLRLSKDDEAAYRRVLAAGKEPAGSRKRRDAWEAALDVPLQMAQTCQDLHHVVAPLQKECHPVVLVDLEIGTRLLLDGLDAGVRAGKANMKEWRSELDAAAASERDRQLEALGRKRAWQEMQVEKE